MQIENGMAAIVTGGASGLGEATARILAEQGAKVTLFDLNTDRGNSIATEIGGTFAQVNVADEASLDAGFATARAAHGQERIMVSCAGVGWAEKTAGRKRDTGEIVSHSVEGFARVININLVGTFMCMSKSAAGMMTLDPVDGESRGVVINTASVAAVDGQIGQLAYSASKGGIVAMTLPAARDLSREGIRVLTILPGFFETPIYDTLPPHVRTALEAHTVFPARFGRAEEYGNFVLSLVGNDYINGEHIRLDAAARMPPR
ncbi:MAG: 3-hydroxy-2-methylbutyryl-CoA dehydrogenase [Robiginitomaculum sp.]|nr:MAG: 3-hydroxy-2-methylbutyryl-CoA dehydrogenase [Robiginitomaculum sp.]